MSSTRMAVVVRRDLRMSAGLLASQVLHIGMGFVKERIDLDSIAHPMEVVYGLKGKATQGKPFDRDWAVMMNNSEVEWITQPYVAVLAVDTPEELEVVIKTAKDVGLPIYEWRDVIPSKVFEGRVLECLVGIAIGPADSDALRKVTGMLPLYGGEERV